MGVRCLGVLLRLLEFAKYKRRIAKYVPLEPYHIQVYTFRDPPTDPLKPCSAPGPTIVSGGSRCPLWNTICTPKGAAAKPPPPSGSHILLGGALVHPLKVGLDPGQHKVWGGPLSVPLKRKYILEYAKASGVRILQLLFIFCILNVDEQNT